ncbi:hypothetical protein CF327_g7769 [Tilletia walkeri]|nr:hypothetical protein CF327_g7769 [Tilletia walkeri]
MPNFTSVGEVSEFVDRSILWRYSKGQDVFMIFGIIYTISIVVALSIFIGHTIMNQAWWIFRVIPRGHSKILIPNVHNSWTLFIGIYGWILISTLILSHVHDIQMTPVPHKSLWISMMWAPIAFAAWYQAWGLTAAKRSSGSAPSEAIFGKLLSEYMPSWLFNVICVCLPGVPTIVALVPAVMGDFHYERARHGWADWHARYGGNGTMELNRDMLLDAQNIFHQGINSIFYTTISLTVWVIICFTFGGYYYFAALSLIVDLRKHLKVISNTSWSQRFKTSRQMSSYQPSSGKVPPGPTERNETAIRWKLRSEDDTLVEDEFHRIESEREGQILTQMFTELETVQDRSRSFFPPVAPSKTITTIKGDQARKVLFYFTFQSAAVMLGCIAFIVALLVAIRNYYPGVERNNFQSIEAGCYIAAAVSSIVAGTFSAISVTHATFEASFAALINARRSERGDFQTDQPGDIPVEMV